MSPQIPGKGVRQKRPSQKQKHQRSVAARKKSVSKRRQRRWAPHQFRLLIDENLTPGLVKFAKSRGFLAVHVNDARLTGASDKSVTEYAIENGMILVTNNVADFRRHYSRRKLHPGLVFMVCATDDIFTDINQATLLNAVLDDLLESDLVQEAIRIELHADEGDHLVWDLTRHVYPSE